MSMSISLVAVFIPILMMGGIIGRLFREFAVVLSITILVSLAVSLTTTPMMCSRLLRIEKGHGRLYVSSERAFKWILGVYERSLAWVLGHSILVLMIAIATLGLNVYLYIVIPKGFFPQQDTGRLNGSVIADQDTSFQAMKGKIQKLGRDREEGPRGGGGDRVHRRGRRARRPTPAGSSSPSSRSGSASPRRTRSSPGCAPSLRRSPGRPSCSRRCRM